MSFHIRVSGRGIVIKDDKIILNEFGNGEYFNIPGGAVEPGETVKDAVVREIQEETGLDVTVGELIYTLEYEPNKCDFMYGKVPHISFVFRCYVNGDDTIKSPTIPDVNPDNPKLVGEPKWIPISRLKDINYIPYIHDQLMEYLETNKFSPVFIEEPLVSNK
ncbi:NUDIX domain-containing protein [Oceanirhabdus sp. W0125-5]|uniref:NUDIX domain-containing protein n=1 Tax=Oceanirhabdus sp. W0125-5 TaxID=2999116 RepID=UPI0022F2E78C|nr:NUDIX domain-containing protein [Oceanirhabdus sp. W0125-5]WBW96316.1 NUDIX domain-containing protein [Oceanirhabdus sp. W0125-5]